MSDHTVKPSAAFTKRAVTRIRPPSRCTVPTNTMLALSALASSIGLAARSRAVLSVPDATRSPGIRLNAFVTSAVMPAAKYASLVSRLMLTRGITAIDFVAVIATAGAGVEVVDAGCRLGDHAPPAATDARMPAPASAHNTRLGRGDFGAGMER